VINAGQADIARIICRIAHAGQIDKAGHRYHNHPIRVAEILLRGNPNADDGQVAAALLHDGLEDTAVGVDDLTACGISDDVIRMLRLLTRRDGLPNEIYFASIAVGHRPHANRARGSPHSHEPLCQKSTNTYGSPDTSVGYFRPGRAGG